MGPKLSTARARGPADPYARRIVEEKIRVLKLLRSLDRAGIDPAEFQEIRAPLVRLAEADGLLTRLLELIDRDPGDGGGSMTGIDKFFTVCEAVRGDVLDALPPRDREAVGRAMDEVVATEAEIWLEIDGFRRQAPRGKEAPRREREPLVRSDEEVEAAAERTWSTSRGRVRLAGAARVTAQERIELPDDDDPLAVWFAIAPEPWRRATARLHDLEPGARVTEIAARLEDRTWTRRYLAERLGTSEREILALVLAAGGVVPLGRGTGELRGAFETHWDWEGGIPASTGGRLRAAGLVHVGRRRGARVAAVPPALRIPLAEVLKEVDPRAAGLPERSVRGLVAKRLDGAPFADPELGRWKKIDRRLGAQFEKWLVAFTALDEPLEALFGPGPRVTRSEAERVGVCDYLLFDWRAWPGEPTLAERSLETTRFKAADEQALARATVAAVPAVWRVTGLRRGEDLTLLPIFPPGPAVKLTDRALSLTAEEGWVLGARVYRAGPYHFCRTLSDPLPASAERRLLRVLEREREAHARAGGTNDAALFLRERPAALLRALRSMHP